MLGIGVAGNFAGHLDDAGEANNFKDVSHSNPEAPKGIFPFYIPGNQSGYLNVYPYDQQKILLPKQTPRVQPEPEIALLCNLEYTNNQVTHIIPTHFGAFNDCSLRLDGGNISTKKNWGPASRGAATSFIEIDSFSPKGIIHHYRLACFIKREGVTQAYGVDSWVKDYAYMYEELLTWMVDKMNTQKKEGVLDKFSDVITQAGNPKQALISIGCTRYTDFGKTNYLKTGDILSVITYDARKISPQKIEELAFSPEKLPEGTSVLLQEIH